MISFSQTWHRIAMQLKRKRSFHSQGNSKSVRFYDIDTIFYTHSSLEYDRTPSAELHEDDYMDEGEDEDEDEDEEEDDDNIEGDMPSTPLATNVYISSSLSSPSSNSCYVEKVIVVDDHSLNWEKSLACLAP